MLFFAFFVDIIFAAAVLLRSALLILMLNLLMARCRVCHARHFVWRACARIVARLFFYLFCAVDMRDAPRSVTITFFDHFC